MNTNNLYKIKNRFGILFIGILTIILFISSSAFCYELNGTATGNILQGGYNAEGENFSASADIENGYALKITKDGKTITANAQNSSYLNICDNTIYHITVNGDADRTELRSYNVTTGVQSVLYSVPLMEGMKFLYLIDNCAYFQSNHNVFCFDLKTKTVKTVLTDISEFIPINGSFLYAKGTDLFYQNSKIAEDCLYFDCDTDTVYYSNGEDGIYAKALNEKKAKRIGNGGTSLVADDTTVYWQYNDMILSYEKNQVKFEQVADKATTSLEILPETGVATVEEEIGEGGSASEGSGLTLSATTKGMPAGDYKNWKQFDSRWGDIHLGESSFTIRSSGCAATSVAILLVGSGETAARYLQGDFDPGIFVTEMSNNGGFTKSGGIYWSKVGSLYPTFKYADDNRNFSSLGLSNQCTAINSHMEQHNYLVLQVKTSGTHFVAADYAENDTIYVCDPGKSSSNTLTPYNAGNIAYRAVIFKYSGNNSNWGGGSSSSQEQPSQKETVATPIISINGNTATITCETSGATIYYTTNGNTPTTSSKKYTASFSLSNNATIKAIAVKSGYNSSSIAQTNFTYKKSPFKDVVAENWFFDSVLRSYNAGLIAGMDTNHFSPDLSATRAQFVCIISRINDQEMDQYGSYFVDVFESDYFYEAVNWAFCKDITAGTSETTFGPDEKVTREQACCFLVRMADYLDTGETGSLLKYTNPKITFKDDKNISTWARDAVSIAQQAGLVAGYDDGKFYPQKYATRAEIAAMVIRMVED